MRLSCTVKRDIKYTNIPSIKIFLDAVYLPVICLEINSLNE